MSTFATESHSFASGAGTPLAPGESRGLPSVSVVLATYKRDELLPRCLRSVLEQDIAEEIREIVVVDDARSPSTAGIVAEVQACYPATELVLLDGRSSGPAAARNIGWRRATGEVIAFIDDDARAASRDWLRTGLEPFRDARVTGVSGAVTVPIEGRPTDFQRNVQHLEDGVFLTCNAFYRRRALEAVDGFDERFTFPFREDSDLYYRVEALGGVMVREPLARVIHPAPLGRFGISARLQRYSASNALLYKKHPERYRREVQSRPPLSYYAMVIAAMSGLAALLCGRRTIGRALIALWLAMDLAFFAKRSRGTSRAPRDVADVGLTSLVIPALSIFWRLRGAARFRVWFV
jgi:glycosyltransferase involved in cell wall biosynthesis